MRQANLLSDALAQQVRVVRGQAEKSGQKSSPTLNAQEKLSRPNINRARSSSSGSSASSVSGRGQSMPRTTQSIDRPATARPSLGLNAAARKGPTSVSGYTPPIGASPIQRPSSGGRAQPSTKAASPRTLKVANRYAGFASWSFSEGTALLSQGSYLWVRASHLHRTQPRLPTIRSLIPFLLVQTHAIRS